MIPVEYDSKQKYYFLSENHFLDEKWIYPRTPKRRMRFEDCFYRRICLAPSIYCSLKALPLAKDMIFSVYEAEITPKNKIVIPEDKEVLDAKYTREHWCLNKIQLHKKGEIIVKEFEFQDHKYKFDQYTFVEDVNKNIRFYWLEKN